MPGQKPSGRLTASGHSHMVWQNNPPPIFKAVWLSIFGGFPQWVSGALGCLAILRSRSENGVPQLMRVLHQERPGRMVGEAAPYAFSDGTQHKGLSTRHHQLPCSQPPGQVEGGGSGATPLSSKPPDPLQGSKMGIIYLHIWTPQICSSNFTRFGDLEPKTARPNERCCFIGSLAGKEPGPGPCLTKRGSAREGAGPG